MVQHAPDEGAYCHACMVPTSQASVYPMCFSVAWHQLGTYVTSIAYDPLPDANVEPAQPQLASEHVAVDPCFCKCIDSSWRMGYHWDCAC
ncbi:hypothetical protein H0G86_013318 [Trichoderma simmonsii]|uniref:Uncharacterized protein n=1 Tax=Trichoderma simmonsii TaxID=1491479 RepID=A0A8G0L8F3_9HYPO|nr:hypothetical protein H0G86_013318 [Trichoderma simmonsii]